MERGEKSFQVFYITIYNPINKLITHIGYLSTFSQKVALLDAQGGLIPGGEGVNGSSRNNGTPLTTPKKQTTTKQLSILFKYSRLTLKVCFYTEPNRLRDVTTSQTDGKSRPVGVTTLSQNRFLQKREEEERRIVWKKGIPRVRGFSKSLISDGNGKSVFRRIRRGVQCCVYL
ncbi:hypothetical protein CEXT_389691 [Caerostris extrusa]|uniref:Uncharacterized protein n=1 Tax=Caerostris extrusa TaxID=172846 RepID=A0AAV4QTP5_CAEEX|nr:hypothetical protein CEXT_389691 [Caerostris extrusa]